MAQLQDGDETPSTSESPEHEKTNEMGPGGVTGDQDIGIIVSGQPAGGPNDLGKKAHDDAE